MESNLCMNCFAGLESGSATCPVCGWDNTNTQPEQALEYLCIVASRYQVGRVKARNGEGFTYAALDLTTHKEVELREFFPDALAERAKDGVRVIPFQGQEDVFEDCLDAFVELMKNVSRLREVSVVHSVLDIFEENYTAYAVYEFVPSVTLRRYVEGVGGSLPWNTANPMFLPVLTALGLFNSLGVSHLGISPDTLRVTKDATLLITGFSISAARRAGTPLAADLAPGCAALEQYSAKATCGEISDVYGFAATLFFALTGETPADAPRRLKDPKLMISKDVLHSLPPFAVTALANALQVRPAQRTASFERFKTELSAAPTLAAEVDQTEAIRRIPPLDIHVPQGRGLPPFVWLIGSGVVTLVALVIVASLWMGDRGMSFSDLTQLFSESSSSVPMETVPNLVNTNYEECLQKVESGEYPFQLEITEQEFNETVAEGCISSQVPFSGEPIPENGVVTVTVSRGSAQRTLPDYTGVSYEKLEELLTDNGFVPQRVEEASEDIEAGYVVRYEGHAAGDSLDYGSSITVVVSTGPAVTE